MDITRDIGSGVFTWTDVVTGVAATRADYSRGSAVNVTYSGTQVAWKNGTITLAQSSANTGLTTTASIYVSSNGASVGIYTTINGQVSAIAVV